MAYLSFDPAALPYEDDAAGFSGFVWPLVFLVYHLLRLHLFWRVGLRCKRVLELSRMLEAPCNLCSSRTLLTPVRPP